MTLSDYVRPATLDDAEYLAPRLREADLQEIQAASGLEPKQVLSLGVAFSTPSIALTTPTGDPVALLGVSSMEPGVGAIWLLASKDIEKHTKALLRHCRDVAEWLNQQYPVLYNYVDARNTSHIRWLKWCGFTLIQRHEQYGVEKRPFIEFVRIPT